MIDFQEREPFISNGTFSPTRQNLVPIYMIKDGVEYFVANLPIESGSYSPAHHRREMDGYKSQLLQTNGKYFKFNGFYRDPEKMIVEMIERGQTFVDPDKLFTESPEGHYGAGFVSFWGNRNEVSAAFHYRIFDREYAAKLMEQIRPLLEKKGRKKHAKIN